MPAPGSGETPDKATETPQPIGVEAAAPGPHSRSPSSWARIGRHAPTCGRAARPSTSAGSFGPPPDNSSDSRRSHCLGNGGNDRDDRRSTCRQQQDHLGCAVPRIEPADCSDAYPHAQAVAFAFASAAACGGGARGKPPRGIREIVFQDARDLPIQLDRLCFHACGRLQLGDRWRRSRPRCR